MRHNVPEKTFIGVMSINESLELGFSMRSVADKIYKTGKFHLINCLENSVVAVF